MYAFKWFLTYLLIFFTFSAVLYIDEKEGFIKNERMYSVLYYVCIVSLVMIPISLLFSIWTVL